jgi:arsenate reductase
MAEGLLLHDFGDRLDVQSAGTIATSVRPEAIAVLAEVGIDISHHRSKSLDKFRRVAFDDILTVCDAAAETCPVFPGPARRHHREFHDPAAAGGSEADRLSAFRRTRDDLLVWLHQLYGR